MDPAALASAFIAASAGQFQLAVAGKMLAMNLDAGRSAVKLIDAAQQNIASLANVSAGIGTNVDMTARAISVACRMRSRRTITRRVPSARA